jgi:type IV secretion system protein VirB11
MGMHGDNTARDLLQDILAPIRPLLAREDITDLCINGPGLLFVEGLHGWEQLPAENLTESWLMGFAKAVASWMSAGIGERSPILSGHLPTGERVQIVLPPAAEAPSVTIRRPSHVTFSLEELAAKGPSTCWRRMMVGWEHPTGSMPGPGLRRSR